MEYEYHPLPSSTHLRCCTIQPSPDLDAAVTISIDTVPFEDDINPPKFEALSYVWGTEENPLPVYVKSEASDQGLRLLLVTQSIHCALRHMRLADRPRTMWIDAICINQKDNGEKGPQVAMMGRIYRLASRVVVWLGSEADGSDHAIHLLRTWGSLVTVDFESATFDIRAGKRNEVDDEEEPSKEAQDLADPAIPLPVRSESQLKSINALLQRSWFSRLWIRQEISLGNQSTAIVCCGTTTPVPYVTFRSGLVVLLRKPIQSKGLISESLILEFYKARYCVVGLAFQGSVVRLTGLRIIHRRIDCKDPRDRIYAVLGMLAERDKSLNIVPDYTRPYGEVYEDIVLRYFHTFKSLDLISQCDIFAGSPLTAGPSQSTFPERRRLPTWIPDFSWTSNRWPNNLMTLASSHIQPIYDIETSAIDKQHVLKAAGLPVTTIDTLGPLVGQMYDYVDPLSRFYHATSPLFDHSPSPETFSSSQLMKSILESPPESTLTQRHALTLLAGFTSDKFHPPDTWWLSLSEATAVLSRLLSKDTSQSNDLLSGSKFDRCLNDFLTNLDGRRLGWDRDGDPILCPGGAQIGDQVCVIAGCSSPMLLRPEPLFPRKYAVVGRCFTAETCDGDVLLGPQPKGIRSVLNRAATGQSSMFVNDNTGECMFFDPRLQVQNLGFDLESQKECATKEKASPRLEVDFGELKNLVRSRTGRELAWLHLI